MKRFATILLAMAVISGFVTTANGQEKKSKKGTVKLTTTDVKNDLQLYRKTPQGELYLQVFYPPDWKATDKRPAIVFFFGGGWKNGDKFQFVPYAAYLATRGMVAASADYRILSKHKTTPDVCVEDAKSAIRWLRDNASKLGIDGDKIIASGGSAGGHLAAATALVEDFNAKDDDLKVSCKPNALVLYNPALNMSKGKVLDAAGKDISKAFSPTLFLKKGTPPTIMFFGTDDKLLAQGEEFLTKSRELGNRCELYTADKMGHGFFNNSPWTEVTAQKTDEFLASLGYLQGPPTLKTPAGAKEMQMRK